MVGLGLIKLGLKQDVMSHMGDTTTTVSILLMALRTPLVLLGMVVGFGSTLNLIHMLCRADLITATPLVVAAGQVMMIIISLFLLHEPMTWSRGVGVMLILAGSIFLAGPGR
jgi:drug/metabolite transporter (DMT)-like permease